MDVGKPKRIYRVEPVRNPVPAKRRPRTAPKTVPAK
jgi:hypothetical protein